MSLPEIIPMKFCVGGCVNARDAAKNYGYKPPLQIKVAPAIYCLMGEECI
jgi:hypothetical protein